jgi:hypothetical protein
MSFLEVFAHQLPSLSSRLARVKIRNRTSLCSNSLSFEPHDRGADPLPRFEMCVRCTLTVRPLRVKRRGFSLSVRIKLLRLVNIRKSKTGVRSKTYACFWLEAEATDKITMSALPRIAEADRTAELGQLMTQSGQTKQEWLRGAVSSQCRATWILKLPRPKELLWRRD